MHNNYDKNCALFHNIVKVDDVTYRNHIYENDYGFLWKMNCQYNYLSKVIMIDWDCEKIEIMKWFIWK